ncbi:MAG TPA: hypothetical protein VGY48_24430 [Vicinamibacterales bacterium]|nr:hypothetical protein [Vicinamibacterales bacterium]
MARGALGHLRQRAHNNVGSIYAAYNKKLQVRPRPSSFAEVASTPSVPHPYPLSPANLKPVPASILSPWENSVQKLVASSLPCVTANGQRTRHTYIEMALPLDLFIDYLLDIEMLDASAADGSPGQVVWSNSFSTGGFRTTQDFATSFQIIRMNHRGTTTAGALQAIGTQFAGRNPEGSEFDDALINAGLDALTSPKIPARNATAARRHPGRFIRTDVAQPPAADANHRSAARRGAALLTSQLWMDLVQQAGGDNIVDQIVAAPGGQRALVTLNANSRGKHIMLALRRIAHSEAYLDGPSATDQFYDNKLTVAPWEETD